MGNYVYEQLVRTHISTMSDSTKIRIDWPFLRDNRMYLDVKAILTYNNGRSIAIPITSYNEGFMLIDGANIYEINIHSPIYLHIVYTSMPEEEGDSYGYNNY